jgi:alanyl-tRNA synthetase
VGEYRLKTDQSLAGNMCSKLAEKIIDIYHQNYPNLLSEKEKIISELNIEESKFLKVIEEGIKKLEKLIDRGDAISGEEAFDLFSTYGFPFELTQELAQEKEVKVDQAGFESEFEKHQEVSRGGLEKKFTGGLEDKDNPEIIKLHTTAHLTLAAMREILGPQVYQKGSNITAERLRFDFSHPEKLTDEQKKAIEDWVNEKIAKKLDVYVTETNPETAKEKGAEGEFDTRYGDKTTVYSIGGDIDSKEAVSKEICGGPHVKNTGELGHFRIKKEESSSAGVRRIKAVLE